MRKNTLGIAVLQQLAHDAARNWKILEFQNARNAAWRLSKKRVQMIENLGEEGPVGKALAAGLSNKERNRKKRKRGVIHPSELSICPRMAQYSYWATDDSPDKVAPKDDDMKIFRLGHWLHGIVQKMLMASWPNGVTEQKVWDERYKFYGHCDFYVPGERAVEIKTVSSNVLKQLKHPRESHIKQCAVYGVTLQVPVCNLFYISRENGKHIEFQLETDIVAWVEMCAQAHEIITATKNDELVPGTASYMVCKSCGYRDACELWEYKT